MAQAEVEIQMTAENKLNSPVTAFQAGEMVLFHKSSYFMLPAILGVLCFNPLF